MLVLHCIMAERIGRGDWNMVGFHSLTQITVLHDQTLMPDIGSGLYGHLGSFILQVKGMQFVCLPGQQLYNLLQFIPLAVLLDAIIIFSFLNSLLILIKLIYAH